MDSLSKKQSKIVPNALINSTYTYLTLAHTDNIWHLKSAYPTPKGWFYNMKTSFAAAIPMRTFLPAMKIVQLEEWVINETATEWSSFDFRVIKISLCTFFPINTSGLLRTALYIGFNHLCFGKVLWMKFDLKKVIANGSGGWESFLFIASTNYDQRPEMHFAYIKENVLPRTKKHSSATSLCLMVLYIFYRWEIT